MHSSRMRTVRSSGCGGGGRYPSMHWARGVCVYPSVHLAGGVSQHALGVSAQGVSAHGGVCLWGVSPSACWDTQTPCGQNDRCL